MYTDIGSPSSNTGDQGIDKEPDDELDGHESNGEDEDDVVFLGNTPPKNTQVCEISDEASSDTDFKLYRTRRIVQKSRDPDWLANTSSSPETKSPAAPSITKASGSTIPAAPTMATRNFGDVLAAMNTSGPVESSELTALLKAAEAVEPVDPRAGHKKHSRKVVKRPVGSSISGEHGGLDKQGDAGDDKESLDLKSSLRKRMYSQVYHRIFSEHKRSMPAEEAKSLARGMARAAVDGSKWQRGS